MNKIKIIALMLICVFTFCLSGCSHSSESKYVEVEFVKCGRANLELSIYYDTNTKVMYVVDGHRMSVLMNADGTPMLYDSEEVTDNGK